MQGVCCVCARHYVCHPSGHLDAQLRAWGKGMGEGALLSITLNCEIHNPAAGPFSSRLYLPLLFRGRHV